MKYSTYTWDHYLFSFWKFKFCPVASINERKQAAKNWLDQVICM